MAWSDGSFLTDSFKSMLGKRVAQTIGTSRRRDVTSSSKRTQALFVMTWSSSLLAEIRAAAHLRKLPGCPWELMLPERF